MPPLIAKYLSPEECKKILLLKKKGSSIHAISREINRSRGVVTKFIKSPEEYINKIKIKDKSKKYEKLNNSSLKKTNNKKSVQVVTAIGTPTSNKKSPSKIVTSTPNNKKIIRKSSGSSKKFSDDDIKRFNRVSVEYRAVIKYLIKKGIGPRFVYEDIQKVYGSRAPDLESILYWSKQFQQGRQTIVNEPAYKQLNSTTPPNKIKSLSQSTNNTERNTNTSKSKLTSPPKQVKLFKFKFKPLKRLNK